MKTVQVHLIIGTTLDIDSVCDLHFMIVSNQKNKFG